MISILCECNDLGLQCHCTVEISEQEFLEHSSQNHVFLSNDCPVGPEKEDELVEKKEKYSIYIDSTRGPVV